MSGGKPSSKRKGVEEYEDASANTEVELHVEHDAIFHDHVPIVSYYNDRITTLLDAVDRLRQLQVVKELLLLLLLAINLQANPVFLNHWLVSIFLVAMAFALECLSL